MLGISIRSTIGIGDGLQFSSLPENYYRARGERLIDVSRPWFFDKNPYVDRTDKVKPTEVRELWNFGPTQYLWPSLRTEKIYLSNAEIWAGLFGVPVVLNRPRLYHLEEMRFNEREMILLHTHGRSHGAMPNHVVQHVLKKYASTGRLFHIGTVDNPDIGIPRLRPATLWELSSYISRARMLIGMDSGPAWIAACYPDVVVKKIRTRPTVHELKSWVPLSQNNIHSHWDDRCHQIFNVSEDDVGFTQTYRKI